MERCVVCGTLTTFKNVLSRRDCCLCGRLENYDGSWALWLLPRRLHDGTGEDSGVTGLFKDPSRAFTWSRNGTDERMVEGEELEALIDWFRVTGPVIEVMSS